MALITLSGCATYHSKDTDGWGHPYGGTRCAIPHIQAALNAEWFFWPFTVTAAVIDIPLSVVADTALLPVDLVAIPYAKPFQTCWYGGL